MKKSKHIPPTTEEKLLLFKKALVYVLENGSARCICIALREAQYDLNFLGTNENPWSARWNRTKKYKWDGGNNMANNFPELLKRKPKGKQYNEAWWTTSSNNPSKRRVAAVNDIIKELEAELLIKNNDKP